MKALVECPENFFDDPLFRDLAVMVAEQPKAETGECRLRDDVDYNSWGSNIDPQAEQQMSNACRLPVSLSGAPGDRPLTRR